MVKKFIGVEGLIVLFKEIIELFDVIICGDFDYVVE